MPVLSDVLSQSKGVAEGPPIHGRGSPLCSEFGLTGIGKEITQRDY